MKNMKNTTIESRLNFSEIEPSNTSAVLLKTGQKEPYYTDKLIEYCKKHNIDYSEDNCSAMIMSDYLCNDPVSEFWFWIDK